MRESDYEFEAVEREKNKWPNGQLWKSTKIYKIRASGRGGGLALYAYFVLLLWDKVPGWGSGTWRNQVQEDRVSRECSDFPHVSELHV